MNAVDEPATQQALVPTSAPPDGVGWPQVLAGHSRDRPLARMVVGTFGLVLGASTGLFLGGMLGVVCAAFLLPYAPSIAFLLLLVTSLTAASAGAVVGSRVLQRETFDTL